MTNVCVTGPMGYLGHELCRALKLVPGGRDDARRFGLVTLAQMTRALVRAVEFGAPAEPRFIDVLGIRAS